VQVLSLSSEPEARARRDKLIHRGYRARVELAQAPKGSVYRVRVGPYSRREEAERASERLSREEKVKTWIAPSGK
jgi:cell division septation protein DedD